MHHPQRHSSKQQVFRKADVIYFYFKLWALTESFSKATYFLHPGHIIAYLFKWSVSFKWLQSGTVGSTDTL